jgi:hypothetical protein
VLKLWGILTEARPPYPVFPITESQIFPATLSGALKKPDAEKIVHSTPLHRVEWNKSMKHTMYEFTCMNSYKCLNHPLHYTPQSGVEQKYEFIQSMNSYKCLPYEWTLQTDTNISLSQQTEIT